MSSGTSITYSPAFWLWPLPPSGTLRIACEWPLAGIALTQAEVDAAPIVAAASRVRRLWDEGTSPAGAWTQMVGQFSSPVEPAQAETVEVPVAELRELEAKLRRLRVRRGDEE